MNDRGQGRKPLSPTGELMKSRPIRMLDSEWADAKLIGMAEVRRLIVKAAKKLKAIDRAKEPAPPLPDTKEKK